MTTAEKSKASLLPQGFGVVADVAGVAGLLLGGGKGIVLTAGLLGALAGSSLVLMSWGKPLGRAAAVGLAVALIGAGVFGYRLGTETEAPASAGSPVTPIGGTPSSGTSATGRPTAADTPAAASFTGQVRLTYGTGVDLDRNQAEGTEVTGPNGDVDLFLKKYDPVASPTVLANGGDLYADDGPAKDAQARCAHALKEQEKPSLFYVSDGAQYCFATSGGDTGWMRINDRSFEGVVAKDYVVLDVEVWKRAA
ncbi:hypothetical protein Amsp01_055430 [Amycolatopsis sp. NBRC 101858]|uniref:hypothetical protein n=1 Tax=Amycolatopsis sp. NBRC 101858 TaxID=3032200 RepID=UPI0024A2F629|nr:hypothetical protein [Amycolatopsis sp. NBRC 101858]GLY39519.1 hypothetical protein Amsp01_055430 [Amycolatopsis sp. NBRC 101858]